MTVEIGKRMPMDLERKIFEAHQKGHSYRELSEMFELSATGAANAVKRYKREHPEPIGPAQMGGKQLINLDNLENSRDLELDPASRHSILEDLWNKIFSYEWDSNDLPLVWNIAANLRELRD